MAHGKDSSFCRGDAAPHWQVEVKEGLELAQRTLLAATVTLSKEYRRVLLMTTGWRALWMVTSRK